MRGRAVARKKDDGGKYRPTRPFTHLRAMASEKREGIKVCRVSNGFAGRMAGGGTHNRKRAAAREKRDLARKGWAGPSSHTLHLRGRWHWPVPKPLMPALP